MEESDDSEFESGSESEVESWSEREFESGSESESGDLQYSSRAIASYSESESDTESESNTDDTSSSESEESAGSDLEAAGPLKKKCIDLPEYSTPLYQGADISVLDSYLLLYKFALRHTLTKKAFSELIGIVSTHLPPTARCASSLYSLQKYFETYFNDLKQEMYEYCKTCHQILTATECSNGCTPTCKREFLYIPVEYQLKTKLEDPATWKLFQKRFETCEHDGTIRDIYDGQEYRKQARDFTTSKANVSLLCNTDGVKIFNSSKCSIWPIWLVVNELPPSHRFLKHSIILAGLWFDFEKPTMTTYMYPLMKSMNHLQQTGIKVETPDGSMMCHAKLLLLSVDLPAQAYVLNSKQYNGKHGCNHCEAEGKARPSQPMVRDWPYEAGTPLRTHSSVIECIRETLTCNTAVKGVKGASVMCKHRGFDLVQGVAIDTLHVVYLGVTSDLLSYWFDKKHARKSFNIRRKIKECDARLLAIKVPDIISRCPRTIEDFSHWKGSQLRAWLLYFSLPVLKGILSSTYYSHLAYLVAAMHLLLGESISEIDLQNAQAFLLKFYVDMERLYGLQAATMKVHLLSHLVHCVRNWGPLWAYTCFQFEGMNNEIKKLFHGSKNMSKQLAFNHTLLQSLPAVITAGSSKSVRVISILDKMQGKKWSNHRDDYCESGGPSLIGEGFCRLNGQYLNTLNNKLKEDNVSEVAEGTSIIVAHRLVLNNCLYYSEQYKRVKSRNSYTVQYGSSFKFGKMQFFVSIHKKIYVIITELNPVLVSSKEHFQINNFALDKMSTSKLFPVVTGNDVCLQVTPSLLLSKCVYIHVSDPFQYVVTFPNRLVFD